MSVTVFTKPHRLETQAISRSEKKILEILDEEKMVTIIRSWTSVGRKIDLNVFLEVVDCPPQLCR